MEFLAGLQEIETNNFVSCSISDNVYEMIKLLSYNAILIKCLKQTYRSHLAQDVQWT